MRVGVVGLNHKLAELQLREILAKTCLRRLHPASSTHGNHAFVSLSTCNRTEIYFSSLSLADTHSYLLNIMRQEICEDFDQKLYSYFGQDCLHHLCRVTAGLDSAIVAETEIQGQVKGAYAHAQEYCRLPFELHYLFQKSLGIAKKVRSALPSTPGLPDVGHAIFQTGSRLFKHELNPSILFVGASDINETILGYLKSRRLMHIALCNRSESTGRKVAEKHKVAFVPWEHLETWHTYDWIILGTKATDYLITQKSLPKGFSNRKLIIDLSVPRNVDPALAMHTRITLLNIDQLNRGLKIRRETLANALAYAEDLISQTVGQQMQLFQEKERSRLGIYVA